MDKVNDGGPAFPTEDHNYEERYSGKGMTLRDYFAAKALGAIISNQTGMECFENMDGTAVVDYNLADAMLRAREAK